MNRRRPGNRAGSFALIAGLTLMVLGVLRGEVHEVLSKAVQVCLQCIGIG